MHDYSTHRRVAFAVFAHLIASTTAGAQAHPEHTSETFLERVQDDQGRFPFAWNGKENAPKHAEDLRTSALAVLAFLGDGSTMRSGPGKNAVKKGVMWLLQQNDEDGRLAYRNDRSWIRDHAIATYAVCEAARLSSYKLLHKRVRGPLKSLCERVKKPDATLDPETLLWFHLCARSATQYENWWRKNVQDSTTWSSLPGLLDRLVAKRDPPLGTTERARAARILHALLRDAADEAARTSLQEMTETWPQDRDPMTVFYVCIALHRLSLDKNEAWTKRRNAFGRRVKEQIVDSQNTKYDELRGSWHPSSKTPTYGRVDLSAVHVLVLEIYYRYCRLELFQG